MLRSPGRNQREHERILRQEQDRDEDIGNVRKVIAGRSPNSPFELCRRYNASTCPHRALRPRSSTSLPSRRTLGLAD